MTTKKVIPIRGRPGAAGTGAPERPPSRAEIELMIQKTRDLVLKSPQKAASILTGWIKQSTSSKKKAG